MCSKTETLPGLEMGISTASFNIKYQRQKKNNQKSFSLCLHVQHIMVLKNLWSGQEPEVGTFLWNVVGHVATAVKDVTAVYTDHLKLNLS